MGYLFCCELQGAPGDPGEAGLPGADGKAVSCCRRKHCYFLWELIEVCVVSFIMDFQRVPINKCCLTKTLFQSSGISLLEMPIDTCILSFTSVY